MRDQFLGPDRELKKAFEHEGDDNTYCKWCAWDNTQRLDKEEDAVGQKTEKMP